LRIRIRNTGHQLSVITGRVEVNDGLETRPRMEIPVFIKRALETSKTADIIANGRRKQWLRNVTQLTYREMHRAAANRSGRSERAEGFALPSSSSSPAESDGNTRFAAFRADRKFNERDISRGDAQGRRYLVDDARPRG